MMRFLSDDGKAKKNKSEKVLADEPQQRIIELDKEKLGKLKERVLDIEPTRSDGESDREETGKAASSIDKQSAESKESLKDAASKKGTVYQAPVIFNTNF